MKLRTSLCLAIFLFAGLSLSFADVTLNVYASSAPNAFGSPSFAGWSANAITALETGASSVGNPATDPTAYYQVTSLNSSNNIVTGFPSWQGQANPGAAFGAAFINELGNRVHFGLHADGGGALISLSELTFDMHSSDPGNIFAFTGDFTTDSYSASRVGLNYGGDGVKGGGDDFFITSGAGTQLANELFYIGVGNALAPGDASCTVGSQQDQLDCVKAFYQSLEPFSLTTDYSLVSAAGATLGTGSATVPFADPVPEPSSLVLFGSGLLAMAGGVRRRLRK